MAVMLHSWCRAAGYCFSSVLGAIHSPVGLRSVLFHSELRLPSGPPVSDTALRITAVSCFVSSQVISWPKYRCSGVLYCWWALDQKPPMIDLLTAMCWLAWDELTSGTRNRSPCQCFTNNIRRADHRPLLKMQMTVADEYEIPRIYAQHEPVLRPVEHTRCKVWPKHGNASAGSQHGRTNPKARGPTLWLLHIANGRIWYQVRRQISVCRPISSTQAVLCTKSS